MASVDVRVPTSVNIEVRARLYVLHDAVYDLACGFYGNPIPDGVARIIRKGILENQYLSEVRVHYLLGDGKMVGYARIKVDWQKHSISLHTGGRKDISIDRSISLLDQISQMYRVLFDHTAQMRKAFRVKNLHMRYFFRHEICSHPEKLAQAHADLGLEPAEPIMWAVTEEQCPDGSILSTTVESSSLLEEVTVEVAHLRKPPRDGG